MIVGNWTLNLNIIGIILCPRDLGGGLRRFKVRNQKPYLNKMIVKMKKPEYRDVRMTDGRPFRSVSDPVSAHVFDGTATIDKT